MNRLHFSITCNRCGGSLVHINGARPSSLEAKAILACVPCRAEFSVSVALIDLGAERISSGYRRERVSA